MHKHTHNLLWLPTIHMHFIATILYFWTYSFILEQQFRALHLSILGSLLSYWCLNLTSKDFYLIVLGYGFGGLPWWLSGKESACNAGGLGSIPGWGRFLGEGNGQRSLVGYSPWGHEESDMTEQIALSFPFMHWAMGGSIQHTTWMSLTNMILNEKSQI